MNTLEAKVTLIDNAVKALSSVQPAPPVIIEKPSFITILFKKFTNTWKT